MDSKDSRDDMLQPRVRTGQGLVQDVSNGTQATLATFVGDYVTCGMQNSAGMQKRSSQKLAACRGSAAASKGSGGGPQTLKPVHSIDALRSSS